MESWKFFLEKLWRLTKVYWQSEEKKTAWGLLLAIVVLNLGSVYMLVLLNTWYNTFYSALQEVDRDASFSAIGDFCILAGIFVVIAVYRLYLQQLLEIKWRRWITVVYLKDWLANQNYYRMQLTKSKTDNPDQRISDDLRLFTNITLTLSLGLLNAVVTLCSFVFILWELSGVLTLPIGENSVNIYGYMVWAALAYAIIGTYLTHLIGKPLINLNFNQQKYEANFRFSLVRLRENSESVAFYNGEEQEEQTFMQRFRQVFENFWTLIRYRKRLTWFASIYGQAAVIFPIVMAMPRYFAKEINLGGLMQINAAFGNVQDSLSFFVDSYAVLAEWRSVVDRLTGFVDDMEKARLTRSEEKLVTAPAQANATDLILTGINVNLPNGRNILKDFNFTLHPGDALLVTGTSGAGKSTLLRTLAGIWPYADGKIELPSDYNVLFVPQKPYLPLGTLKNALLYPQGRDFSEERLKKVLELCRLDKFSHLLDTVEDWSRVFSLGEQQRIAFARIILKKPRWLFLDESTSALDEATEKWLYTLVREELKTTAIVSVGHRSTLNSYHNQKLAITGNGNWSLLS